MSQLFSPSGGAGVQSVVAGTNVTVNNADPKNPIVSSSGGSSGLVWTFDPSQSGTPAAGHFQTNNANPSSIGALFFNITPKNGLDCSLFLQSLTAKGNILLTASSGKTYIYNWGVQPSVSGSVATVTSLASLAVDAVALSGDYTISFAPAVLSDPTLGSVLAASGIVPVADGTVTPVTSETTQTGIVTALS
jgi:hypothetical protein